MRVRQPTMSPMTKAMSNHSQMFVMMYHMMDPLLDDAEFDAPVFRFAVFAVI